MHALVSYKCANLSVNARACAGVHVLDRFAGTIRKKKKGRQGESEEWEGEGGGGGGNGESYMKITYSPGPALKRSRTYNRRQLKASYTSMPDS